jgi:hypothetical protein
MPKPRIITGAKLCGDCGIDTTGKGNKDWYMVKDHVWAQYGNEGVLCWGCLEKRMGRPVSPFEIDLCPLTTYHNPHTRQMLIDAKILAPDEFVNAFRNRQKIDPSWN